MLHTAETYVEHLTERAMEFANEPYIAFEVKVDISDYVPEAFGRCDCVMFGGDTLMRTPDQYRWADAERRPENVNAPWPVVPNSHPYNSVSHAENPRGIGLVDLVYALEEGRKPRASGEMALHSLEVMECILKSAHEHVFCESTTTFEQPKPLDWQ